MKTGGHYDAAVIGAGLSGLAAGIRLAHFGKRVCLFERHSAVGGLNSFYSLAGRRFDVGLHALTNFARAGGRGTPLTKVLRQLRIDRGELELFEQRRSRIAFGAGAPAELVFTNDFSVFESEVARAFPGRIDRFRALVERVRATPLSAEPSPVSAREALRGLLGEPLLEEMLLCPILFYGGAAENDMDFNRFAMLFQAVLLEGLSRPREGIRAVLRLLVEKYRAAGGERRMNCGVARIRAQGGRVASLVLDSGEEVTADQVLSCAGAVETAALLGGCAPAAAEALAGNAPAGRVSFVETISVLDRQPAELGWDADTIVFFNDSESFSYAVPPSLIDTRSGVICIPNNFEFGPGGGLPEGLVRVTCLASPERWADLSPEAYREAKRAGYGSVLGCGRRFLPPVADALLSKATVATDMFTPLTIERFTGHRNGAIYGSPVKSPRGATALENLHLCGTDQGLLGIVGSMLSGITMANQHVLMGSGAPEGR